MLLLWLSIVSMIPFDMVRLDSNRVGDDGNTKQPIMDRIIEAGKVHIILCSLCQICSNFFSSALEAYGHH